jgi:hypothetical protein
MILAAGAGTNFGLQDCPNGCLKRRSSFIIAAIKKPLQKGATRLGRAELGAFRKICHWRPKVEQPVDQSEEF